MIYLIGGAARCGKTTLARDVRQNFDGQVVSHDAVMVAIRSITTPDTLPDIFDKDVDPIADDDPPQKRIARLRRRDDVVWKFMKTYFGAAPYANDDVLGEGCLWPSMLKELNIEHKAVFLVDTSLNHAERLIHIRDTSEYNNWMHDRKYTDEYMHLWADFNIERSREIIKECEEFGYRYFDIADNGIEQAHRDAAEYLLNDRV